MPSVDDLCKILEQYAPTQLAEAWDNVGLLVGDRSADLAKIMTCLTLTPESVREAVAEKVDLVVAHHPLPFRALKRITTDTPEGRMLLDLISAGIAIYSPHTSLDSCEAGINQHWAIGLNLIEIMPIIPVVGSQTVDGEEIGAGRLGLLPETITLNQLADRVKTFLDLPLVRVAGDPDQPIEHVAIACGSGGTFLASAKARGANCLITGEATFHQSLEARANEVGLILTGHFFSERFALDSLADFLSEQLPTVQVWASRQEASPIYTV